MALLILILMLMLMLTTASGALEAKNKAQETL